MRILHTVASLSAEMGGPSVSVPGLASASVDTETDFEVYLWSPDIPASFVQPDGVSVLTGALGASTLRRHQIDILHDHGVWSYHNHRMASLARKLGLPRVVIPRGMLEPWALRQKRIRKAAAWNLYQKRDLELSAGLHATASTEADQFNSLGLTSLVHVVPNALDSTCDWGTPRIDRPSGPRIALFLSRIHPKKGLDMLISSWDKVRPVGWEMRVVGPGEDDLVRQLKSQIERAGLSSVWSIEGAVSREAKVDIFKRADLFILPTHSENFGNAVLEALASGLPVLTTTGAPWRSLEREGCGWCVEPSVAAISEALREATSLSGLELNCMGKRGASYADSNFSSATVGRLMREFYSQVVTAG